jgi:hydroxymethylglutaryl-CoA lyase
MRNTHKTIAESLVTLEEILKLPIKHNKEVVAYLSWVLEIHMVILGM